MKESLCWYHLLARITLYNLRPRVTFGDGNEIQK